MRTHMLYHKLPFPSLEWPWKHLSFLYLLNKNISTCMPNIPLQAADLNSYTLNQSGLLKSLFLSPPTTPKRGKRRFCRLGATAPKRQNLRFLLGRGLLLLSTTFAKPCWTNVEHLHIRHGHIMIGRKVMFIY